MANINLGSSQNQSGAQSNSVSFGLIVVILAFLLTVVSYVGLLFWSKFLDGKISDTRAAYDSEYAKLTSGNAKGVVDFQNRMDVSKKLLKQGVNSQEVLSELEKLINPGVYLESYSYDEKSKTVSLVCLSDNYNLMAKQILSFKSGEYFASVSGGKSSLDTTQNKVSFEVDLKVK